MRLSTKLSGIVAIGGVAALGAGLISSGGIGAEFTSGATATAQLGTGTFGCEIVPTTATIPGVTITNNGKSASVDLGIVSNSQASSRSATIRIHNTGSIPAVATWSVAESGNLTSKFVPIPAVDLPLGATDAENMNIGFDWSVLANSDLNRSGKAIYTLTCVEAGTFGQNWLIAKNSQNVSVTGDSDYSATWTNGATPGVNLHITPQQSNGQQADVIKILNVVNPSTLPTHEPNLTTTTGSNSVRLNIRLSDGANLVRYPNSSGWEINSSPNLASNTGLTWQQVSEAIAASSTPLTVVKAFVIADAPQGVDETVTCINYSGTPLFGGC